MCHRFGTGSVSIDGAIPTTACVEKATYRTNEVPSVTADANACAAIDISTDGTACTANAKCKYLEKDDVPTCL